MSFCRRIFESFFYSRDMLLPFIQLDKAHDDVKLSPLAKIYFYVHKFAGCVLAMYLPAGLSGLSK
jgi:hypothetical protein